MVSFSQASDTITLEPLDNSSSYEDSWDDAGRADDDFGQPNNNDDWDNDDYPGYGDYRGRYPRQSARCMANLVMGREVIASFRAHARGRNFRHARRKACKKAMRKCRQGFHGRNVSPSFGVVRCEVRRPRDIFGPY